MTVIGILVKIGIVLIILGILAQAISGVSSVIPIINSWGTIFAFINTNIIPLISWFISLLPPTFRVLLQAWIGFLILHLVFTSSIHIIFKIWHWVKWGKDHLPS